MAIKESRLRKIENALKKTICVNPFGFPVLFEGEELTDWQKKAVAWNKKYNPEEPSCFFIRFGE